MARRDKHLLGRALVISVVLHAAVLSLQFGAPGKGVPALGWDLSSRKVTAPPPPLRVELLAAPVEVVVASVTPLALVSVDVPSAVEPVKTALPFVGAIISRRSPAPPVVERVAPRKSTVPVRKRQKVAGGVPVLSIEQDAGEDAWRMTVADAQRAAEERAAQVRDAAEAEARNEAAARVVEERARDEARHAEAQKREQALAAVQREKEMAEKAERVERVEQQRRELLARQRAEDERQQLVERAEVERVAARVLQRQREEQQARAQAQAEEVRRGADEEARLKKVADALAASQAAEAVEQRKRAEVLAEEQQRRERDLAANVALARAAAEEQDRRRREALAETERRKAAAETAVRLAEERRREEQRREEQRRQDQAAVLARLQEEARAKAAVLVQAEALARAEAQARATEVKTEEARRLSEQAAAAERARAAATREGERTTGRGAALASRALDMARSGAAGAPLRSLLPATSSAPPAPPAPPSRTSFLGRNPAEIQLSFYGDSWEEKVRRLSLTNYPGLSRNRAYGAIIVSVSIRSDGGLAGVSILRSSGSRELDEAARRIIEMCAPFAAFPPDLRRNYDVVEIRRTLSFPDQPPLLIGP